MSDCFFGLVQYHLPCFLGPSMLVKSTVSRKAIDSTYTCDTRSARNYFAVKRSETSN